MNLKRIGIGSLIIILSITLFISGCSPGNQTNEQAEGSAESSKEGGTLVYARITDSTKLDPHFITDIPSSQFVYNKVFETLIDLDKDLNLQPLLATEWELINDTTWEFKLREDVFFQDGSPFNADVVKMNFERILTVSPHASDYQMIKEVEVIDDHTFQLKLEYPFAPILSLLASYKTSMISPKVLESLDEGEELQNPIGTGPFVFKSRTQGENFILNKNEDYWGERAKVDQFIFKIIPEDSTRIGMLETGEADIAEPIPVTEMDRIESHPDLEIFRGEAVSTQYLGFNVQKEPFNNVKVRQAISHAIEREAILKGVFKNVGNIVNTTMSPKVFGHNPNIKGYEYNINKAKELLKEAGYQDGFKTTLWVRDRKEDINLGEVIQSQLQGIGIEVEVKVLEFGAVEEAKANGEAEFFIETGVDVTGDGDYNQYRNFHSDSQGIGGNFFFYSNPKVDKLIEEARAESNEEKRKELYAKAQEIEMKEALLVPIRTTEVLGAKRKDVKGFWMSPIFNPRIEDAVR